AWEPTRNIATTRSSAPRGSPSASSWTRSRRSPRWASGRSERESGPSCGNPAAHGVPVSGPPSVSRQVSLGQRLGADPLRFRDLRLADLDAGGTVGDELGDNRNEVPPPAIRGGTMLQVSRELAPAVKVHREEALPRSQPVLRYEPLREGEHDDAVELV